MTTYTDKVQQAGIGSDSIASWANAAVPILITPGATDYIGLLFNFGSGVRCKPESLTLTPALTFISDVTQNIYVVDETTPGVFDAINNVSRFTNGQLVCSAVVNDGVTRFINGTPFTFQLGRRFLNGTWSDDASLAEAWNQFWVFRLSSANWNGRVAFIIQDPSAANTVNYSYLTGTELVITASVWPFDTGVLGWPLGMGRVRLCPKSGLPTLASEFVRDGYVEGMWVSPDYWDPEDPPDTFRPNPREGVVKDELP